MITDARLPLPTLKIVASFFTKSFSLLYCDKSILWEESKTNNTSNSVSHVCTSIAVGVVVEGFRVVDGG